MLWFFWAVVAAPFSFAQNPLIRDSIGQHPEQDSRKLPSYYTAPKVKVADWVGKTFIFLPRDRNDRAAPYRIAREEPLLEYVSASLKIPTPVVSDPDLLNNLVLTHIVQSFAAGVPYETLVGSAVKVTGVHDDFGGYRFPRGKFVFLSNSFDFYITYALDDGTTPGLALLSDIELGRQRWIGMSVRPKREEKLVTYDDATGTFGAVSVTASDVLRITDVVAGFNQCEPARVIVMTNDGREAFQDFSVSGTNCVPVGGLSPTTFTDRFDIVDAPTGR